MPARHRDLVAGSATIATMLVVSASAKIGYGVWALGLAILAALVYRVGSYVTGRLRAIAPLRRSQA